MHDLQATRTEGETAPSELRLPDFFIIGAAKCGTTTLYKYLSRHPQIFMSTPKEMSYFSKDEIYRRGVAWYASLFDDAREDQICGEASTTYTRWPHYKKSAERLAALRPEAKLIYLVRNPIDRLYSFYAHRMRETVTTTFEDFIAHTPEAVDSGRYMTQIQQYLEHFSARQLLVVFSRDMRESPQATLEQVGHFLNLPTFDYLSIGTIQANEGGGKYYAASSLTRAIGSLKRAPAVGPLLRCVPADARNAGYQWLANGPVGKRLRRWHQRQMSTITPLMRQRLCELYREEIEQLQQYTGRNLTHWKQLDCTTSK